MVILVKRSSQHFYLKFDNMHDSHLFSEKSEIWSSILKKYGFPLSLGLLTVISDVSRFGWFGWFGKKFP